MAFAPVGHWTKVLVKTQTAQMANLKPVSFFVAFILSDSMQSNGGFPLPPFFRDRGKYHTNDLKNKFSQIF